MARGYVGKDTPPNKPYSATHLAACGLKTRVSCCLLFPMMVPPYWLNT